MNINDKGMQKFNHPEKLFIAKSLLTFREREGTMGC